MKISFNRHAERKRLQPAASIFFITDYIFDGWYCESDEEPYPVTSQTLLTSNITLRARWKNGKYIISFNANSGENAPSSITFNPGQSFTVPDQQPRRFGYTFEGWSTNAESTSGSYYPGKTVTPSSSMTLYAAWKSAGEITYGADEYRIYDCTFPERHIWYAFTPDETTSYFFRAAGEPDEKAVSVLSGKNSYLIPSRYITDASRIYAEFALTAGKTYYIQLDIVGVRGESGSLMIYKGHPVSYHMGSSTETDYCYDDQEDFRLRNGVTRAHTFQLNENYTGGSVSTISRTNSVQSWNTSSALTGTSYAPGSTQRFTRTVTLYPQWSKASFGTLPTPSRSGYTFDGWYTERTGGVKVTEETTFHQDTTLYAHWIFGTWESTPALDLPVLEEDCVILTWYSAVPAQAYSVYELGEDNTLLFKAKVTACRAEIRNILPGAHTYIVMPTQQNANGVWQYGKPSNQVTIQYAGNQPLTLPAALSRLEASAFEGNNAIYEVKFTGNRVTAIGDYAFRNCKNLLKITIPDSVTSFGRGIFDGCGKLVVYCSEGSAAQAYCESNQLAYKLLPN